MYQPVLAEPGNVCPSPSCAYFIIGAQMRIYADINARVSSMPRRWGDTPLNGHLSPSMLSTWSPLKTVPSPFFSGTVRNLKNRRNAFKTSDGTVGRTTPPFLKLKCVCIYIYIFCRWFVPSFDFKRNRSMRIDLHAYCFKKIGSILEGEESVG